MSASKSSLSALTLGAIGVVYGDIGTSPLYAMREAFSADDGMRVEVEEYLFDDPHSLQRRLNRVRTLNRL